jgi:hypothetical protein
LEYIDRSDQRLAKGNTGFLKNKENNQIKTCRVLNKIHVGISKRGLTYNGVFGVSIQ